MGNREKKPLTKETFRQFLEVAGLELSNQDLDALSSQASRLFQNITLLEEIDLGETEPVLMFDVLKGG